MCVSADSKGLSNPSEVEALREKVYASLEAYCKQKYPEQPGRYEDKWSCAHPQTLVLRKTRQVWLQCVFTLNSKTHKRILIIIFHLLSDEIELLHVCICDHSEVLK